MGIRLQENCLGIIRKQQKDRGWLTQREFAAAINVDPATITRFYKRDPPLSKSKFIQLIDALFEDKADWQDFGEQVETSNASNLKPIEVGTIDQAQSAQNRIRYTDYTERFKSFVDVRLEGFVGRQFVFDKIAQIQSSQPSGGYISIIGRPGDGKSAIAANYLQRNPENTAFFFNIRKSQKNTTADYLEAICGQLVEQYGLNLPMDDSANWQDEVFLHRVLARVSSRLTANKKLVLVIDALDEADELANRSTSQIRNPLYLPEELPNHLYCLLTRRRTFELKGLSINNNATVDLSSRDFIDEIRQDVSAYIERCFNTPPLADDLWYQLDRLSLNKYDFTNIMFEKSQGNFMYLTLVTQEIARGTYQEIDNLNKLPEGLEAYYEQHWQLLEMDTNRLHVQVLRAFLNSSGPVSLSTIGKYFDATGEEVGEALKGWWQFLQITRQAGQQNFEIYHESFRDFLRERSASEQKDVRTKMLNRFKSI